MDPCNKRPIVDDITVRLATINDCEDIINISQEIYQMFDYIPGCYIEIAQDKRCYNFVAEYKGQIIGFRACYFIDECSQDYYLNMAERVYPDYQRMGVNQKIGVYSIAYLRELKGHNIAMRYTSICTEKIEQQV